ncbi:carbohydrate ABC transporter permease [Devriesea agamarum]|uniref:carbohydrate ABC transporter permease n=1 Tax=Devriesea agamarum TaxID=472569 RepID=UPI000A0794E4|nr:carbohydrate ABC transporter permease [Devriesea agamarum]
MSSGPNATSSPQQEAPSSAPRVGTSSGASGVAGAAESKAAAARPRRVRREAGRSAASRIIVTSLLSVIALYFLVPLYWVIINATKSSEDLFGSNGFWFGHKFLLWENLKDVFTANDGAFVRWGLNSLLYAGLGALLATYFAAACGYALAKYRFRGRNLIFGFVLGGVLVPGTAVALPLFFVFNMLGLTNTYWSVLIPSMVSPFGMFLARIYADAAIPDSLLESGRLDGAGELRIFHSLALRQLAPALVTIFLFQFVAIWNNYLLPLVMLADESLYPITLGLTTWNAQTNRSPEFYSLTIGGALVSVIPLVILMLILQRFWRGGLTEGSVKG